jgi:hypothetical protein
VTRRSPCPLAFLLKNPQCFQNACALPIFIFDLGWLFKSLHSPLILEWLRNSCTTLDKDIEMYKVILSLTALVVSFAASSAQASTVNFDSGSAKVDSAQVARHKPHHKQKVWVPAHRSHGRLVRGHYIWR